MCVGIQEKKFCFGSKYSFDNKIWYTLKNDAVKHRERKKEKEREDTHAKKQNVVVATQSITQAQTRWM